LGSQQQTLKLSARLVRRSSSRLSLSTRRGPIDTDRPTFHVGVFLQGLGDPVCLAVEVQVEGAQDQAGVLRIASVEPQEVLAIQREDDAALGSSELQQFGIRPPLPAAADIIDRHHVVARPSKNMDRRKWEIFVSKEARHRSICFVLSALGVDELA
jgi:hypothetical protein